MSRRRYTDNEKAGIIRDFGQHDGSAADFCRQRKLSYQTFMKWRRAASVCHPGTAKPSAFLEFELGVDDNQPAPAGPVVELELGGGIVLRIHPARTAQP